MTTTYAQVAAPLSQVLSDGTANYVYGHDRLRALGGPWYVGDALGSVRQTLDDAGGVLGSMQYDPWGVPTAGTPQPFGFTGELHSAGQVYLRARWYAPGQGTFTSRDPFAGFPEMPYSLHAYQYAYSNPVRWTDPTGENPLACVPIALVDSPVLGPADVVAGGCLVLVGGIWLVGTLVALTQRDAVAAVGNSLVAPHTGHPAPAPPPLASGPPATSGDDIGACVVPGGTTLLPPDTGIWLGPSFIPQPWPFTTEGALPEEQGIQILAAGNLYSNRYPELWSVEQAQAERLGIDPAPVGTPEWHETLTQNQLILWAVNEEGILIIMPQFVRGEEPAHPVLVNARPVQAAGTAQVSFENGWYVGEHIDGQSGHYYQPGWPAEEIGRRAFEAAGISFP